MSLKQDLFSNAKEYFEDAIYSKNKKNYNSAVTLFFKAISSLADLYLLMKKGKIPSNHSERFKILRELNFEIYNILDKDFPFYQESYRTKLNLEVVKIFENDFRKILKIVGIRI
ncbi:MAG: hypothetical protein KJ949_01825 [Nanoarchaeota archaeon]|nr:hypothetical protein [Nanoarchaeota archaeon]